MYPFLNADTNPIKNKRLDRKTLNAALKDFNAHWDNSKRNERLNLTQQDKDTAQWWPRFGLYATGDGTGCCGVPSIIQFASLKPHPTPATGYTGDAAATKAMNKEFRKELARFVGHMYRYADVGQRSGKLIFATLTHSQMVNDPHLLDILNFCGFEVSGEFVNSGSSNGVTFFTFQQKKAYKRPKPSVNSLHPYKAMRKRAKDRVNGDW